jgi:hypothetical protein
MINNINYQEEGRFNHFHLISLYRFSSPQNLFYSGGENCQALYGNNGSATEVSRKNNTVGIRWFLGFS